MNIRMKSTLSLAFKAVALGMAALSITLAASNFASLRLYIILISIGLFSLAVAGIADRPDR